MEEVINPETAPAANENLFPSLLARYQAVFIDALVIIALMIISSLIIGDSENGLMKGIVMAFIWFVYEPLFTCLGCTLGQLITGVRVRQSNNFDKRINIFQAYLRIIVKWIFGVISFFTVHSNPHKRAIHDYLSGSVVISVKKQND